MLPTTKDSYPAVGTAPEGESSPSSSGPGDTQRRTDAVGTEVPVVVHASRYSSASAGVGKNLPPVHEETRTVIVFPNGAVVRISAAMAAGELVVLTNLQTGADVICRVVNVKAQAGIQNYVNLEFTQRAPGFWDASSSSSSKGLAELPQPATQPQTLPPPAVASQTKPPAPPPQIVTPKPIPVGAPAKASFDSSPAPAPIRAPEKPRNTAMLSGSLLGSDYGAHAKPQAASTDTAQVKSWPGPSGVVATEVSGSKKILLIIGAAVVLLGAGATGGAWLFRNKRPSEPTTQAAANSPEQSVPLPPVTTDQNAELPPQQDTTAGSLQSAVASSGADSSVTAAQSAVAHSADERPGQNNVRSSVQPTGTQSDGLQPGLVPRSGQPRVDTAPSVPHSNIDMQKLTAPVAKASPNRDSVEAPVVGSQISGLADSGSLGSSIAAAPPRVSAPAPLRKGGQIQPAKPLSSPAPSYPAAAFNKRIEGVVMIDAELDNTGRVISTQVLSGPPELQVAALTALRKWKYQPAMLDGLAVGSHTQVSITFSLPPSSASSHK